MDKLSVVMAYNKKNHLTRVLDMQIIVQRVQCEHKGIRMKEIYWRYVWPRFKISYATFINWRRIPAKRELEKLEKLENE